LQHIKKRLATAILIAALLPLQVTGVSEANNEASVPAAKDSAISQTMELSLKDACEKAQSNTYSLKKIDKAIENLWKQEDKAMSASNSVQQKLDNLEEYRRLYKKQQNGSVLSGDETTWLRNDMMMFGYPPPDFTSEEMYEGFIKTRDLTHYDIWAQVQNQKRAREVAKFTIEDSVRSLYYNVLYMRDKQSSSSQSFATMEKEYKDVQERYKKGLASEVERYQCEIKLSQQKLRIRQNQRNLENAEMQLKNICGIPASQEINLEGITLAGDVKLSSYNEYCKMALENRNEVLTDKLGLEVATRKLDIMKQYKTAISMDRMDIQQQVDNARFSLSQSTADVLEDIQGAYSDVISKQSNIAYTKKALDTSNKNLLIAQKQYELGQAGITDVWDAKDKVDSNEIDYKKAQQDFDYAYYKINLAVGVGPGYKGAEESETLPADK
jgi:hypothetical protein